MIYYRVASVPSTLALTLAEAKAHLRIDIATAAEDAEIEDFIRSAQQYIGGLTGILGRFLVPTTVVASMNGFPAYIPLAYPPIQSITHVKYTDTAGVLQTVNSASYRLVTDMFAPYVTTAFEAEWPSDVRSDIDSVQVTFVAGYADVASIPSPIKQAIKLMVGEAYARREMSSDRRLSAYPSIAAMSVDNLLRPHRLVPY